MQLAKASLLIELTDDWITILLSEEQLWKALDEILIKHERFEIQILFNDYQSLNAFESICDTEFKLTSLKLTQPLKALLSIAVNG